MGVDLHRGQARPQSPRVVLELIDRLLHRPRAVGPRHVLAVVPGQVDHLGREGEERSRRQPRPAVHREVVGQVDRVVLVRTRERRQLVQPKRPQPWPVRIGLRVEIDPRPLDLRDVPESQRVPQVVARDVLQVPEMRHHRARQEGNRVGAPVALHPRQDVVHGLEPGGVVQRLARRRFPVDVAIARPARVGRDLQAPSVDVGDHRSPVRAARRHVVDEHVARHAPRPAGPVPRDRTRQARVVEVPHPRAPASEVVVHLDRPQPRIAAHHEGLARRPHQAAPEQVVHAHEEAEAIRAQVVLRPHVHRPPLARRRRQNQRIGADGRDDCSHGPCQDRASHRLHGAAGIGMEGVHDVAGRIVAKAPLQGGDEMRGAAADHHGLRNADRRPRRAHTGAARPEEAPDMRLLAHGGVGIEVDEAPASGDRARDGRLPGGTRRQAPVAGDDQLAARQVRRRPLRRDVDDLIGNLQMLQVALGETLEFPRGLGVGVVACRVLRVHQHQRRHHEVLRPRRRGGRQRRPEHHRREDDPGPAHPDPSTADRHLESIHCRALLLRKKNQFSSSSSADQP